MESHRASTRFVTMFTRKLRTGDSSKFHYPVMDPDADNAIFGHLWIMFLDPLSHCQHSVTFHNNSITFHNNRINNITFNITFHNVDYRRAIEDKLVSVKKALLEGLESDQHEACIECPNNLGIARCLFLSYGFQLDDTYDDVLKIRWQP